MDFKNLTERQKGISAAMALPGVTEMARSLAIRINEVIFSEPRFARAPSLVVAMAATSIACVAVEATGLQEGWDRDKVNEMIHDIVVTMIHTHDAGAEAREKKTVSDLTAELDAIWKGGGRG